MDDLDDKDKKYLKIRCVNINTVEYHAVRDGRLSKDTI